jgi:plastocyanin
MRRLTPLIAILAILGAGCGGDDEQAATRPATVGAGGTLRVVGTEYSFDPESVLVKRAGPLTISLRNDGSLAHNLRLFRDGQELGGTPTFTGGRTESARVTLEHGRYEMVCTVGNHADLGMTGTLEVE